MYVLSFQGGKIDAAVPARRPIILHVCLPVLLAEKVYPLMHIIISTRDWLIDSGYLVESDAILSSDGRNGKDTCCPINPVTSNDTTVEHGRNKK